MRLLLLLNIQYSLSQYDLFIYVFFAHCYLQWTSKLLSFLCGMMVLLYKCMCIYIILLENTELKLTTKGLYNSKLTNKNPSVRISTDLQCNIQSTFRWFTVHKQVSLYLTPEILFRPFLNFSFKEQYSLGHQCSSGWDRYLTPLTFPVSDSVSDRRLCRPSPPPPASAG